MVLCGGVKDCMDFISSTGLWSEPIWLCCMVICVEAIRGLSPKDVIYPAPFSFSPLCCVWSGECGIVGFFESVEI